MPPCSTGEQREGEKCGSEIRGGRGRRRKREREHETESGKRMGGKGREGRRGGEGKKLINSFATR